jgi:putative acetyltransferase
MIHLERTEINNPSFQCLVNQLDGFLADLNGTANEFYSGHNKLDADTRVLLAKLGEAHVACGGFREKGNGEVEIKRMYVEPDSRGAGVGRAILEGLEVWARELGHTRAILETSRRLGSAVRLYARSGYTPIPNYPPYEDVADSICMAKELSI